MVRVLNPLLDSRCEVEASLAFAFVQTSCEGDKDGIERVRNPGAAVPEVSDRKPVGTECTCS